MKQAKHVRIGWLERTPAVLNRAARRRSAMPAHLTVGIEGEDVVFFYLMKKGYAIVARRCSSGEVPGGVDLIAWAGPVLCFVEVKTRTAHDSGRDPCRWAQAERFAPAGSAVCDNFRRKRHQRCGLMW